MSLTACSAKTPVIADKPQPTGTVVSPSPSPSASKRSVPVARSAVYVADDAITLYDVKADTITQLARGEGLSLAKFVSATQVSFLQDTGGATTLRVLDTKTREVRDLLSVPTGIQTYGWSPDRQVIAYVTTDAQAYPHVHFRSLVADAATQTVATLARALGRDSTALDEARIEFSPDGEYVLIVYTPADGDGVPAEQSQLQVRSIDGGLAYAADHASDPTMGLWSADGSRVFYRTRRGARAWSPASGRSLQLKGGVAWFDPWVSRDGRSIAFDTGATSLEVVVRTLDLRTGEKKTVSKAGYFHPVVANARTVWAQRVQPCDPDCLNPVVPGPEVIAIDLKTGDQRKLAIATLVDVDVLYG